MMKKLFFVTTVFFIILSNNTVFAQEDEAPYLSAGDIAAIELVLPDDVPARAGSAQKSADNQAGTKNEANEISRLNTFLPLYHLLILDRARCSLNADITGASGMKIIYKFKHGGNGYLIAIYTSSQEGPVFPQMPDNSRILVHLITARKNTILEYINSGAFGKFVRSGRIPEIQKTVENNL